MKKITFTLCFIFTASLLHAQVLYGTTTAGGVNNSGAIVKLVTGTNTLTAAFSFNGPDGNDPLSTLIQASDGKLYGLTPFGSSHNAGVIFSYDPATLAYTKLKDFDYTNGANPQGSLMQASDGKLYGMTRYGGSNGYGVIFSYDPFTSVFLNLRSFGGNTTGKDIYGSLMQASDGKLYGMTRYGGSNGYGVIFSYDPSTLAYTKLKDFDYTNGANPLGNLMQASDGKLYGMTGGGGSNKYKYGVIFSFDPVTATYIKLKDFVYTKGGDPYGNLVQASDGKLYGMTLYGGTYGSGVIFSYDISTSAYTKLKDFHYTDGAYPYGSFIKASDGKLYGLTSDGGSNGYGVIFSYDPATSAYTKLKDFDYTNGGYPNGSLMQASDGKLYGMTYRGGSNGYGVIFSFNPVTSAYTKLLDFDSTNGANPQGSLMQASDGKLYGMSAEGGSNNLGVSFSYDPSTSTFTKLADFIGGNGSTPLYTSFIEVCAKEITYYRDADSDGYGNAADSVQLCVPPPGYVTDNTDCNDTMAIVHPGAEEICGNGIDDNCNGEIDEGCTAGGVQITISDNSIVEGDHGVKLMRFKVSLSDKSPKKVIVRYTTHNGTAAAGKDYIPQSGILVFPPGLTHIFFGILVKGDEIPEANETFHIVLHNPVNATIADSTGIFTIVDNDGALIAAATEQQNAVNVMQRVKLLPNPAQDKVNIMLTGYSGNVIIRLSSVEGSILQEHKIQALKPMEQQFNVSSYADGMYFITVIDAKGNRKTVKLVIDR